jgi:Ca2+-binding RTX toxin-like protein
MAFIHGTNSDDFLFGTAIVDNIHGYDGFDVIYGGGDTDWIWGGDETDWIYGEDGEDILDGEDGDDFISGGIGNDSIHGGSGRDDLYGEDGDDRLSGGSNADTMYGGIGDDTYVVDDAGDVVTEYAGEGFDKVVTNISYTLAAGTDIEVLKAQTPYETTPLSLTGNEFENTITGNSGNNIINGGAGVDAMAGLRGNDTYVVDNAADFVWEDVGEGALDRVQTSVSYALTAGCAIEVLETTNPTGTAAINLTGNEFANTIIDNNGNNIMAGLAGNDTYIVHNAGDSVLENVGEGTLDRVQASVSYTLATGCAVEVLETTNANGVSTIDLTGNTFDNTIIGNNGQNTIVGGLGRDTMTGGGGADTFRWASTAETGVTAATADIITDFSHSKSGDLVDLHLIDANTLVAGNQAFSFVGNNPFTAPGQVRTFTDGVDTFIALNTDKDLDPEGMIRVLGVQTVDAGWFVL